MIGLIMPRMKFRKLARKTMSLAARRRARALAAMDLAEIRRQPRKKAN
jgi:hypothetical protein